MTKSEIKMQMLNIGGMFRDLVEKENCKDFRDALSEVYDMRKADNHALCISNIFASIDSMIILDMSNGNSADIMRKANARFREMDIVKKLADAVYTLQLIENSFNGQSHMARECLKRLEGE